MLNFADSFALVAFADLAQWRKSLDADCRLVLTNGCFDLLHVGHVRYLQQARQLGDLLMVGVNSDDSVRGLKGESRPLNGELDRAEVLAALACVDAVTIFAQASADQLIEAVQPSVYTKAGDYSLDSLPERETVMRWGIETVFLPFVAGRSTTSLVERMQQS